MALGYLKSYVDHVIPKKPVHFTGSGQSSATLPEIINKAVPEFSKGSSYWISPLLPSGHFQTAYTALREFDSIDHVHYKRRVITVEDKQYQFGGDSMPYDKWKGTSTFTIDYVVPADSHDPNHEQYRPETQIKELPPRTEFLDPSKELSMLEDDSKPLLIALHGLTGGSYEAYIRSFISKISSEPYGFDALVLNSRGCANHTITSPQLFCGLWTNDLRYLINEHILPRWPNKRIYLIGYSLGGAILANYVGQEADEVSKNIKAALVVASPWSFTDSSYRLNESLLGNAIYSPTMCKNLILLLSNHYDGSLKQDQSVDHFKKNPDSYNVVTLKDFDEHFTSRLFGFNCADEYYRHASPSNRILNVRVPMILLNAADDPISSIKSIPAPEVGLNPYTMLITTTIGGHIGWFDYKGQRWNSAPSANLFKELDKNWRINEDSVAEEDLPRKESTFFKHDRLI